MKKHITIIALFFIVSVNGKSQDIDYNKLLVPNISSVIEIQEKFNVAIKAYNKKQYYKIDTMSIVGTGTLLEIGLELYNKTTLILMNYGETDLPEWGKTDFGGYFSYINKIIIKEDK